MFGTFRVPYCYFRAQETKERARQSQKAQFILGTGDERRCLAQSEKGTGFWWQQKRDCDWHSQSEGAKLVMRSLCKMGNSGPILK
jgi:hypothetical protein